MTDLDREFAALDRLEGPDLSPEIDRRATSAQQDSLVAWPEGPRPVGARVFRIALPAAGQPTVQYQMCIPTTTKHRTLATAFMREVLSKRGRTTLRAAGFGLP